MRASILNEQRVALVSLEVRNGAVFGTQFHIRVPVVCLRRAVGRRRSTISRRTRQARGDHARQRACLVAENIVVDWELGIALLDGHARRVRIGDDRRL